MSLLAMARASGPPPTRRHWLILGVSALATLAIPTLHLAPAGGQEISKTKTPGKIFIRANFDVGGGRDESLSGFWAVDPETATRTRIIEDIAGRGRVSPDGRTLAVSRSGWTGNDRPVEDQGVWTIDLEGKGPRRKIADFGGTVSWSPDGRQVIVSKGLSKPSDDESRHESWRINADGSGATRLPIPATEEVDDWSPDGRWIVTVSDRHAPHGSGYQLYVMRPDGTEQRQLTEGRGLNVYPRFSPDGVQISYLHQEKGRNSLWVVNVDGDGRRQLLEDQGDEWLGPINWSPDGKSFVYEVENWERDEKGARHSSVDIKKSDHRLMIADREGKNGRRLALPQARWIESPDWR